MGSRGASAGASANGQKLTASVKNQLRSLATDYERLSKALDELGDEGVPYGSPRHNAVFEDWQGVRRKMEKLGVETDVFKVHRWQVDKGATTAPKGYTWVNNGESRFGGKFKQTLFPTIDINDFHFKR